MSPARRRARRGQSIPLVIPGTFVIVLLLGAVAIGILNQPAVQEALSGGKEPEAAEPPKVNPFAHLPPDVPQERRSSADRPRVTSKTYPPSPDDLLDAPVWVAALELAQAAEESYQAAVEAKKNDDLSAAAAAGRTAREKFDQALSDTALWEEELLEQYGDRDPLVKRIQRTRNRWFDRLAWLRKSVAH